MNCEKCGGTMTKLHAALPDDHACCLNPACRKSDEFLSGVFSAMQYLVLTRNEPSLAVEIAKEHGIKRDWALRESSETGFRVRDMNRFIRKEMPRYFKGKPPESSSTNQAND